MTGHYKKYLPLLLIFCAVPGKILAQKNLFPVESSALTGINLPGSTLQDQRSFFIAAARTTLELETGNGTTGDMEVFVWQNKGDQKPDSELWLSSVIQNLESGGWNLQRSESDLSYMYLNKNAHQLIMYISAGRREANLYFGKLVDPASPGELSNNELELRPPDNTVTKPVYAGTSTNTSALIGSWGTLAGAKVNWQDGSTGVMVVSGVSKGFGIEFKEDGTFLHVTVVTSGRPNYRVFVSTTGTWSSTNNEIHFYPSDRHYRKWENEIIMVDEHTVPDSYMMFWRKGTNAYTSQSCLFVHYPDENEEREICKE